MYMEYTKKSIVNYIMSETGCNEAQADAIYSTAYEYGHSCGMFEVYAYAQDLCNLMNDFVRLR